jgi:Uma2 family endonuclease
MRDLTTSVPTDVWVTASWDDYMQIVTDPIYDKAKCYYHEGQFRIEMAPVGYDHAADNTIVIFAINLYAVLKNLPLKGLTNCSYRKQGFRECQPDVSYYLGDRAQAVPHSTKIVNLNQYPPPDLAIELGDTTLNDDLNRKKQLYEQLPVCEYWVVNVPKSKIIAFAISGGKSQPLRESQVLPGLQLSVLEEALQQGRSSDQTQVGAWLMQQFQLL